MSPHCFLCSAPVTSPALRTHSSMKPCLLGAERIEIGASPTPKIDSSTNWPECEVERLARLGVDEPQLEELLRVGVRSMIEVMRAGHGRYGFACSARSAVGRSSHAPPAAAR